MYRERGERETVTSLFYWHRFDRLFCPHHRDSEAVSLSFLLPSFSLIVVFGADNTASSREAHQWLGSLAAAFHARHARSKSKTGPRKYAHTVCASAPAFLSLIPSLTSFNRVFCSCYTTVLSFLLPSSRLICPGGKKEYQRKKREREKGMRDCE